MQVQVFFLKIMIVKKNLSICADDFGITKKINKAIIDLIKAERITETSCIVLSEEFQSGSEHLLKFKDKIGIGVHLTLTDFKPLTDISTLIINNKMTSIKNLLLKSINRNYSQEEIAKEIDFQLDRFEKVMGFHPNFIDGHHHVHQLPLIRNILVKILKKRYPNKLPWIRNTHEDPFKILKRKTSILKTFFLSLMGNKMKKLLEYNFIKTNDGFSGIYDFSIKENYEHKFINFLNDINNNHLLMVHPGFSDEILSNIDKVTVSRDKEYDFLLSDRFIQVLENENVVLKPLFTQLLTC